MPERKSVHKKSGAGSKGTEKVPLEKRLKKGVENSSFLLLFSYLNVG
ncbi:hypothetical protein BC792_1171, partial [Sphingobacterium allocomposti]